MSAVLQYLKTPAVLNVAFGYDNEHNDEIDWNDVTLGRHQVAEVLRAARRMQWAIRADGSRIKLSDPQIWLSTRGYSIYYGPRPGRYVWRQA